MSKTFFKPAVMLCLVFGLFYYCVRNNVRMFYVVTGSMEPVIPTNSMIISTGTKTDGLDREKVLVFYDRQNSRVTAHRVKKLTPQGFITKGDANTYADGYVVKHEDVIGQVVGVLPVMAGWFVIVQGILLGLLFVVGVLVRRFLLFLKHGFSCPTTASNALYRFCLFGRAQKTFCSGQKSFGFG